MLRKLLSKLLRLMASSWKVQFLFQKKIKMKMHQRKMLAATSLQCLATFGMLFQVNFMHGFLALENFNHKSYI